MPDLIEEQLADLDADLRVAVPDGLEDAVMARVRTARPPMSRSRRWRRWVAGLLLGLLGGGVVASPVGASIREWFGFHGVGIEAGDPVTGEPSVPAAVGVADLDQAASLAGFDPVVPDALGDPDGVEVSADSAVVSLSWSTEHGTVRLDEFRGTIAPYFWKIVPDREGATVSGRDALWLPTAHEVTLLSPDGDERDVPSRIAAPTLLWVHGVLTLRLEGDLTKEEAEAIAESVG